MADQLSIFLGYFLYKKIWGFWVSRSNPRFFDSSIPTRNKENLPILPHTQLIKEKKIKTKVKRERKFERKKKGKIHLVFHFQSPEGNIHDGNSHQVYFLLRKLPYGIEKVAPIIHHGGPTNSVGNQSPQRDKWVGKQQDKNKLYTFSPFLSF